MNKIIGIYKITSPTNKVYIGQSWNIKNRWSCYKTLNCKSQPRIYNSLVKYGVDNHKFEVLLDFDYDIKQYYLDHCEQFFMDYYRHEGFELMNLKDAGNYGKDSEETKKIKKAAVKGRKNYQENLDILKELKNKPILQFDLKNNFIKEYESIKEASLLNNINRGNIGSCCNNNRKKAGGYIWKFKNN